MSTNAVDTRVLARARRGDDDAWETIYRELAPSLLAYLRAQRAVSATDLLGEVFVGVVVGMKKFKGDERAFRSWVFVIAHHRLLDERRRTARRQELIAFTVPEVASSENVEADVVGRIEGDQLMQLLDSLTPRHKDVLLLRFFAGMSSQEIAKATGSSVGAVKATQHRAIGALRSKLGDAYPFLPNDDY